MKKQAFIDFLTKHQPMETEPPEEVIHLFRTATAYFYDHPDEACIPLLVGALGGYHDGTLLESIAAVLHQFHQDTVVAALAQLLARVDLYTRINSANLVKDFPDDRLVVPLIDLLGEEPVEARLSAAEALEAIGSQAAIEAGRIALEKETDPEVREILVDLIDASQER